MKYAVSFEGYFRPWGCEIFDASSDVEAMLIVEDNHGYGHFNCLIEEGEIQEESITLEQIIEYLDRNNGDGSDYVISVINLETQKTIFTCN